MQLTLYKTTDVPNQLVKNLSPVGGYIEGNLKGPCDIINPVITVQLNAFPSTVNYAYVEEFNRYYFVTNIICEINGLYTLEMQVDPLVTWRTALQSKYAVIERQENEYNLYLQDPAFRTEQKTRTQIMKFPSGFGQTPEIVLTTV